MYGRLESDVLCQLKPKDVVVGNLCVTACLSYSENCDISNRYTGFSFKTTNEWMFFKVTFKDGLSAPILLNVFVNGTRRLPPYTLLVRVPSFAG
jgi:hypothetical protein